MKSPREDESTPRPGIPSRDATLDAVCQSIFDVAPDLADEDLEPSTDLKDDLGLDSIDLVNIAKAIAERTHVQIPEADYARLRRIGEIADFVAAHVDSGD